MFAKVVCLFAVVGVALAQYGHHGHGFSSQHISRHDGPAHLVGHGPHHDYHTHPHYEFSYAVSDPHTGDHKEQHESRDGDLVKGYYSLHQPDGSVRSVHYHGDHHTGFHADVKQSIHHIVPHHHHY